jgi:superfamily II DNA or RNA helicase
MLPINTLMYIILFTITLIYCYRRFKKCGYIYVRRHQSYSVNINEKQIVCFKLGKTQNIPYRNNQYITCELIKGYFQFVYKVPFHKMDMIEKKLKQNFKDYNIRLDGGTEFFDISMINLIEPYLEKLGIKYTKLNDEEIFNLTRTKYTENACKSIALHSYDGACESDDTTSESACESACESDDTTCESDDNTCVSKYTPRDYQNEIIEKAVKYFDIYEKGILVLPCGIGKTLISLWITKELSCKKIVIGVPNIELLKSWKKAISSIFNKVAVLKVSTNEKITDEKITKFLIENNQNCILITTYASAHKVYDITRELNFTFDMKINDEVHHLTSTNIKLEKEGKQFIKMLNIKSDKQLSLTATIKEIQSKDDEFSDYISNVDENYFGKVIVRKSLLWAIKNNIVCDYVIQVITTNEQELENELTKFKIKDENDRKLFLSVFSALKSINDGNSHHLLIYANKNENTVKITKYIKMLLNSKYFNIPDLYYSNYHSNKNKETRTNIIKEFEKADKGIISCVYCLGEGWDCPLLDGVVFSENMSSNIRILQSLLRPHRKNENEPNKIAKIILPVFNKDTWLNDKNLEFSQIKRIISRMSLEDETINHKIFVSKININKHTNKYTNKKNVSNQMTTFGEYDDELTRQLKLHTIKRQVIGTTYEKAKKILAKKNIKSKEEYYSLCEKNCRLPEDPKTHFKDKFVNWVDYLNIRKDCYYDFETCKIKIQEYLKLNNNNIAIELNNIIDSLHRLDNKVPVSEFFCDFYNIRDLSNITNFSNDDDDLIQF